MRTNLPNIWAAGDVAQARGFWGGKVVNGILPNAVEQGRIAGADMADDVGVTPFPGAVPLNTYSFFGQQAISVGRSGGPGSEVAEGGGDGQLPAHRAQGRASGRHRDHQRFRRCRHHVAADPAAAPISLRSRPNSSPIHS